MGSRKFKYKILNPIFDCEKLNKEYDITQSNYGKTLAIKRFEDCEQYDFQNLIAELQNILFKSFDSGYCNL